MGMFQQIIVRCASIVLLSACTSSQAGVSADIPARTDCRQQHGWITLLQSPPTDSVVLHRGGGTILLSRGVVETYLARWSTEPEVQRLLAAVRATIDARGWVQLGEGTVEDMTAAYALRCGLAVVRAHHSAEYIPSLRTVLEASDPTSAVTYRAFYLPDGSLLWRVVESVAVS